MNILLHVILAVFINFIVTDKNPGNDDDTSRIVLNTYIPEQAENLTPAVRSSLENKLNQITTLNGVGGSAINQRFIITAKINVLSKDIMPTAPPMHAYTLDITLFIGDGVDGNLYASYSKQVKGAGRSEIKAYVSALNKINVRDETITRFIDQGKEKIIKYYSAQCASILKEAESLAVQKQYERALMGLMAIPKAVSSCYDKAIVQVRNVFKEKMESECQKNISKLNAAIANEEWNEAAAYVRGYTPGMECYDQMMAVLNDIREAKCASFLIKARAAWARRDASAAAIYLAKIPANSTCDGEARRLAEEIGSTLDEKEKRDWEQEYQNSLNKERNSESDREDDNPVPKDQHDNDNQDIYLAEAQNIALAYSQNQHQKIIAKIDNWN